MKQTANMAMALLALALIFGAGSRHDSLLELRREYGLTATEPLENVPPVMAFTTVILGGFRGLLADVLWLRATELQTESRYVELVQLADWIAKLEPRNTEIWAFHAWNMAYNVSVMMSDPEDRWRWVRHGLELLQADGIRYNRGDPELYWNIGWIFQHKMGQDLDVAHRLYKQRWAEAMQEVLGGPRPDYAALLTSPEKVARLREDYTLDLHAMKRIDERYGPLDWTLPQAHAVYWACAGRQQAGAGGSLACDRMVYQNLATLCLGRGAERAPDPALVPGTVAAYEEALARHGDLTVSAAYEIFLQAAVLGFHGAGQDKAARALFDRLQLRFPARAGTLGYDAFVSAHREKP